MCKRGWAKGYANTEAPYWNILQRPYYKHILTPNHNHEHVIMWSAKGLTIWKRGTQLITKWWDFKLKHYRILKVNATLQ